MTTKNILLGVCGLAAVVTLTGCEALGLGGSSEASNTEATPGGSAAMVGETSADRRDIPAVDTVTGTASLGQPAPDFTLVDINGDMHTLSDYTSAGKVVVLEWFNPQCPFVVKHYRDADNQTMNAVAAEFGGDGVVWLAINSGAPGLQGNGLELNRRIAGEWGIERPILIDETGAVGRAYDAKRTPEMYVIDTDGTLVYHGAIDNNRSANAMGDVNFVRDALNDLADGNQVSTPSTRAYGCSVKYGS